jgi:hypothetical protein
MPISRLHWLNKLPKRIKTTTRAIPQTALQSQIKKATAAYADRRKG